MTYLTGSCRWPRGGGLRRVEPWSADTRRGGDPRGRGQIMADTLVERVTGQASADAVPLLVNLVVSDGVLFGVRRPRPG